MHGLHQCVGSNPVAVEDISRPDLFYVCQNLSTKSVMYFAHYDPGEFVEFSARKAWKSPSNEHYLEYKFSPTDLLDSQGRID